MPGRQSARNGVAATRQSAAIVNAVSGGLPTRRYVAGEIGWARLPRKLPSTGANENCREFEFNPLLHYSGGALMDEQGNVAV